RLLDPMCGSGTLLMEGALMAADVAPGLLRHGDVAPSRWRGFDIDAWRALVDGALARERAGRVSLRPVFDGSDLDPQAIRAARENATAAGLRELIRWDVRGVEQLDAKALGTAAAIGPQAEAPLQAPEDEAQPPVPGASPGLVVCNPPYDARLAADPALYRALGNALRRVAPGWRAA